MNPGALILKLILWALHLGQGGRVAPLSEVSAFLVLPAACSPSPLPFLISHLPSPRAPYIFDLSLSSLLSNPDTRGDTQAVWQHQGFTPRPWQVLGIPAVPPHLASLQGNYSFCS